MPGTQAITKLFGVGQLCERILPPALNDVATSYSSLMHALVNDENATKSKLFQGVYITVLPILDMLQNYLLPMIIFS